MVFGCLCLPGGEQWCELEIALLECLFNFAVKYIRYGVGTISCMQPPTQGELMSLSVAVLPVKNIHEVELTWCLPPQLKYYR